ncbi:MAG TPA: response regulator [Gemmatimonadaceae bacterium]|nr:response regulator [Gemmatimonadaceae bacterium]
MHLLVIDDSSVIRKAMRRILEERGHTVDEAGDGAAALERLRTGAYQAVLCDIDMPVMDGLTFVSTLRAARELAQPPIVMCSTHNSFERITDALERGANEYIMKPFDGDIVDAKLAACGIQ